MLDPVHVGIAGESPGLTGTLAWPTWWAQSQFETLSEN